MPAGTDRIVVKGIRAVGRHGVLPEETERAQPFEVDLEIDAALELAGRRDDIDVTVDYGEVISGVVSIVEAGGYQLLEALGAAIADFVLAHERVDGVVVEVRKLRPPLPFDVGSVAVRLCRAKA
ncbi:MAG: dihydroneopterin aldolase [Acidimicrobiales bacterium]